MVCISLLLYKPCLFWPNCLVVAQNGYIGIVEEGSAKPKKERDLAGAKARKDAERAAKIAKMKALRAAKKVDESKALEEALAVIDNLEE